MSEQTKDVKIYVVLFRLNSDKYTDKKTISYYCPKFVLFKISNQVLIISNKSDKITNYYKY